MNAAVAIIAALPGLIAAAPNLRRFKRHWLMLAAIAAALAVFVYLSAHWLQKAVGRIGDDLRAIEAESPP